MFMLSMVMAGVLSALVQSRRLTENSVMHAAASSLVYGMIEQIKMAGYTSQLPSTVTDPLAPGTVTPPYVKVRINQDTDVWLQAVYSPAVDGVADPHGPNTTPAITVTAAAAGARETTIPSLPLSTTTGAHSQQLQMKVWLWIDELPDTSRDVVQVKKMTLVYTYSYVDGGKTRTIRDREVFVCSLYQQ